MSRFLVNCVQNHSSNCELVAFDYSLDLDSDNISEKKVLSSDLRVYDNIVLGGTFDRLHSGHKILLSEAVIRCNKKLTVGVTDTEMLKTKKLWELIEPCEIRIEKVRHFLEDIEPNLEYDVIPISDMYGPTKSDPSFEMLIVSSETLRGGSKVNELRLKNNLNPLVIHSVELLNDIRLDDEEEDKISSSNYRLRLLGTRIREPEPSNVVNLPSMPCIIGLTGSIASGKSSISHRLAALGAGVIDCDKIGHDQYRKGLPIYYKIINHFGSNILDTNGEIDRKALGRLVFSDKHQLDNLNKILWPAILKKAKELSLDLYAQGHKVIVMEAAVLIQAGWSEHCHEIWTCIIPPDEAVRRIKERTNLSEEEAKLRVMSQPSNLEQVSNAHLVFCTLWRPEYTQKQVERAWKGLMERLNSV
ncbi:hypothetical protein AAG570_009320 [Ranatra chinensis]|uniref:Bifunctional coenzyme A synthase n=1 Tax=Ranatra chinensis TaxID=642074 RepID=A0ABD0ZC24_9HEMI